MAVSKVVYGSNTLVDLTADTVTADKLCSGYTAHGANGAKITGTLVPSTAKVAYGTFTAPSSWGTYTITGIGFTPTRFMMVVVGYGSSSVAYPSVGGIYDGSGLGLLGPQNNYKEGSSAYGGITVGNGTVTLSTAYGKQLVSGAVYHWIAIAE